MAKPFEHSDIPHSPFIISDPTSFSSNRISASSKPARDSDDDSSNIVEDSQKTRRVNPQRLAARLGADLVAEMEALIYPGAKMPTFEVRRVIQERYAVDRRHIYDYFHSRGLRVAKEDKHTNLTRGRLSKALAKQLLEKPSAESDLVNKPLTETKENQPVESQVIESRPVDKQPMARNVISVKYRPGKLKTSLETPEELSSRNAKRVASERISGLKLGRRRRTLSGGAPHSTAVKYFPLKRRRITPASAPPQIDDRSEFRARTPSPCPDFTFLDENLDSCGEEPFSASFCPLSEFHVDLCDVTSDVSFDLPFDDGQGDSLTAIEDRSLTQEERLELYNLINNNIGTSSGIEECAGTYSAYMKERSRHYFDRISFRASYGARIYRAHPGELCSSTRAMENDAQVDFQKWLSSPDRQGRDLRATQPDDSFTREPGKPTSGTVLQPSSTQIDLQGKAAGLGHDSPGSMSTEVFEDTMSGNKAHSAKPAVLHYTYDIEFSPRPSASESVEASTRNQYLHILQMSQPKGVHHRRGSHRLQHSPQALTSSIQIDASRPPVTVLNPSATTSVALFQTAGFMDAYLRSPDPQNVIRSTLYASKPVRLRTTSAGGGI